MYVYTVSGGVNKQGFVWKFFYAPYINCHSFIRLKSTKERNLKKNKSAAVDIYVGICCRSMSDSSLSLSLVIRSFFKDQ